ncbi:MAG TPA: addiction module antidote protein [Pseudolabrys sp.]
MKSGKPSSFRDGCGGWPIRTHPREAAPSSSSFVEATSGHKKRISPAPGLWQRVCEMKTSRFDAARYLDTEERQTAYISAALETGDAEFIRDALGLVARARGIAKIARSADLNRESLYRAFGENGNPEFATVMRVVRALGLTLSARPAVRRRTKKKEAA